MTSLYLAASSADIARAVHWRDKLQNYAVEVISTWIENVRRVGSGNPRDASHDDRRAWSLQCLAEVRAADVLWFLVPTVEIATRGAWLELGYAIGRGVARGGPRIICSGDTKQSIFCALGEEFELDQDAFAAAIERPVQS